MTTTNEEELGKRAMDARERQRWLREGVPCSSGCPYGPDVSHWPDCKRGEWQVALMSGEDPTYAALLQVQQETARACAKSADDDHYHGLFPSHSIIERYKLEKP